jgi:hypothetical protein
MMLLKEPEGDTGSVHPRRRFSVLIFDVAFVKEVQANPQRCHRHGSLKTDAANHCIKDCVAFNY